MAEFNGWNCALASKELPFLEEGVAVLRATVCKMASAKTSRVHAVWWCEVIDVNPAIATKLKVVLVASGMV